MARKIIITVAPVCHVGKEIPAGCKNPLTPEEITEDVINCYKAGACEVHLHTRDLKGNPTFELDVFSDTIRRIREQSDMIIQSSTGGLSSLSLEQRCVCLNVPEVEVASLNLGSVNFGETVYVNTMPELRYWARRLDETNTIPEMEFFDLSHVETATRLADEGAASSVALQFLLGSRWFEQSCGHGSQPGFPHPGHGARQLMGHHPRLDERFLVPGLCHWHGGLRGARRF